MNKCMEIINLVNQSIESTLQVVNNFVVEIENDKLKKLCAKIIGDYEVILDECKMIAKNYKKDIENLGFFEKYQNIISLKLANISNKNTYEISKNIYLSICECMPELYHSLTLDCDETSIAKRLIELNEEYIKELKSFFVIE